MQANKTMNDIKRSIDAVKTEVIGTQRQIQELSTRMENIAVNVQQTEEKIAEMEIQNLSLSKDLTRQELESAAYNIRIQGLAQNKGEDLYEIIADCLAPLVNYMKEEMSKELDHVYRLHTTVTKRMNIPPEVVIRL